MSSYDSVQNNLINIDPSSDECIIWAIRFFLGRNPIDKAEIDFHRNGHSEFGSIRSAFAQTSEFVRFFNEVNGGSKKSDSTPVVDFAGFAAEINNNSISSLSIDRKIDKCSDNTKEIDLIGVFKQYETRHGLNMVLKDINLKIKHGEKIGILGRNGAGKSTLIRLISGAERQTKGVINRKLSVSWPLAFGGAFQGSLTGLDNLRFICRAYNVDLTDKVAYVQDFSELGKYLREPVKTYSSGMRARLAFAISMVIEFDCYLIDEVISVGDSRFTAKCQRELFDRRSDRSMIIVSHEAHHIRDHCNRVCIINEGRLTECKDVDEAYLEYNKIM